MATDQQGSVSRTEEKKVGIGWTDEEELRFRRAVDDVIRRSRNEGVVPFKVALRQLEGCKISKPRYLAEERWQWVRQLYHNLGFIKIEVPKPHVSNREIRRRAGLGQKLFYRPATAAISFKQFMIACGQPDSGVITKPEIEKKISWESVKEGYWFWAEVAPHCPRAGTSLFELKKSIKLLSLEEYVIVFYMERAESGSCIDQFTVCWLRTYFGFDQVDRLHVQEKFGRVKIDHADRVELSLDYSHLVVNYGGRLSERL